MVITDSGLIVVSLGSFRNGDYDEPGTFSTGAK